MFRSIQITFALTLCGAAYAGESNEQEVKVSELPPAITASVQSHYPGATIREASRETYEGKDTWEAGITTAGRKLDLAFQPDGTLVEEEEVIDASALPAVVKAAIAKQMPGATATKAERSVALGKTRYEVMLKTSGKSSEVVFDDGGTIVKSTAEDEDGEKK